MIEVAGTAAQRTAEDIAARREALDVRHSCIVQAPAGSGKTALLTQRYLALLATVDAPEEIIAITFTRKAAAEMRVRIMGALIEAERGTAVEGFGAETRAFARAVLERDREKRWALMDQPSRFRIMTIDALNGWIVRQMPWLSGMGASPGIADDAQELYREAVQAVILGRQTERGLRERISELLVHLDNRYGLIEELLVQMLGIREQWLGLLSAEQGLSQQARGIVEGTLTEIVREHLRVLEDGISREEQTEIDALARHAAGRLRDADGRDPGALAVFLEDAPPLPGMDGALRRWQGIAQLLLTGQDQLRSPRGITRAVGFEKEDPEKARMIDLLERMAADPAFVDALRRIRILPSPRFTDGQWNILSAILEVLAACVTRLRTIFTQRATVDHAEIAAAALRALGTDLAPSDLAMMLEYRIRHLLVDEFQDTSAGQFHLLRLLTAGWMPDDGHTLFLVGDPMQSIYRFREAEVGLFLRIWAEQRIGSVPLKTLRLYRNFRSQAGIVEWVNEAFARIMPPENDPATGAVAYVPSTAARSAGEDPVHFYPVFDGADGTEARTVVEILRGLDAEAGEATKHAEGERNAILVRSRAHLARIIPQLRAEGIPFQAVEIESLAAHPAVQDAIALTRALLHDADRTAWLAVLRAPFCGLSMDDIFRLAGGTAGGDIPGRLLSHDLIASCSADARARLARVAPSLTEARELVGRRPLRALVEACWVALGGPACVDARGLDAVATYFTMLEESAHGGGIDNLRALYDHLDRLYAPPDTGEAQRLQVMTIHKAKGLQFDNVILPRLDGRPRNREERLLIWLENAGPHKDAFLIAPMKERGTEPDATYRYVQRMLSEKEEHEYQRLLYVAATRARRRLILTGSLRTREDAEGKRQVQAPHARSFLAALWPMLEADVVDAFERSGGEESPDVTPPPVLRRLQAGWLSPQRPEPLRWVLPGGISDIERQESADLPWRPGEHARLRGIAVHRLLARVGEEGSASWLAGKDQRNREIAARLLTSLGAGEDEALVRRVVQSVDRTIGDEMGRWILEAHDQAESEFEVTGIMNGRKETVILDRTFVDGEGTRWIVDFKSAEHEGGNVEAFLDAQLALHAVQLRKYAAVMRAYDGRPQRLLLYFPMLQAWRELPPEDQGLLPPSS